MPGRCADVVELRLAIQNVHADNAAYQVDARYREYSLVIEHPL